MYVFASKDCAKIEKDLWRILSRPQQKQGGAHKYGVADGKIMEQNVGKN